MIIYTNIGVLRTTAEMCFNASAENSEITARELAESIVKALLSDDNTKAKEKGLELYNRYIAENEDEEIPLY